MKKLLFLLLISGCFAPACKKEETKKTSQTKNIKYEVLGSCCLLEIEYDGKTYINGNYFNWSYIFDVPVGTNLTIRAQSTVGGNMEYTLVNLFQDGVLVQDKKGLGWQQINYTVQ